MPLTHLSNLVLGHFRADYYDGRFRVSSIFDFSAENAKIVDWLAERVGIRTAGVARSLPQGEPARVLEKVSRRSPLASLRE
jgi:hypothetical protein